MWSQPREQSLIHVPRHPMPMFGRFVVPRDVIRAPCKALIHQFRLVLRLNDPDLRFFTNCTAACCRANLGIRCNRAFQSKPRRRGWHDETHMAQTQRCATGDHANLGTYNATHFRVLRPRPGILYRRIREKLRPTRAPGCKSFQSCSRSCSGRKLLRARNMYIHMFPVHAQRTTPA
jgi:hypothetical protein